MSRQITKHSLVSGLLLLSLGWALHSASIVSAQGVPAIDAIVQAHGADLLPPISVQMIGTVERDNKTEPFRLIATRDEQLRIDYGTEGKDIMVVSRKANFRDDGKKSTYANVPSGFSQLDITGLFFVQQLRNRALRVEQKEPMVVSGVPAQRIRVEGDRTQQHSAKNIVKDHFELYASAEHGHLLAISRSFYEGRPERYTLTFTFSDYRRVEGVLLAHRIEVYLKGRKTQTYLVQNYQFGGEANKELFISRRTK